MDRTDKRWSQRVTETSNALDLEPGVFALEDPQAIAASLKVSADRSERRKSPPFASAMRMLTFYINRAGRTLSADQRAVLEQAKIELRILYGKIKNDATQGRSFVESRVSSPRVRFWVRQSRKTPF